MSIRTDTSLLSTFAGVWVMAWMAAFCCVFPAVLIIHIYQFGWSPWLWLSWPIGWLASWGCGLLALKIGRRGI